MGEKQMRQCGKGKRKQAEIETEIRGVPRETGLLTMRRVRQRWEWI